MLKITAFAKFDLATNIHPDQKDGLYPIDYLDCQIDISDELLFERIKSKIEIICKNLKVPTNHENFVYKAAELLKEIKGDKNLGTRITLKKQIPIKAGFGGGSSDGAAAVFGLKKLWNIKLTQKQLKEISQKLGKDFYYSLFGKLCQIETIGKNYKLKQLLYKPPNFYLLVIKPHEEKPSTGWIYQHLDKTDIGKNYQKLQNLKKAIKDNDREAFLKNLHNDFENSVSAIYPIVKTVKKNLLKNGAKAAIMAGAGLSVVGFFEKKKEAEAANKKLKNKYQETYVTKFLS